MPDGDAGVTAAAQQRVEDRPRAVAHREELPRLLPLQRDAQAREEFDRPGHVEPPQDLAYRGPRGAGEGRLVDGVVRDVAAAAPRHQYLRAQRPGAVESDDRAALAPARRMDGGHQARRAGADDRDAWPHSALDALAHS